MIYEGLVQSLNGLIECLYREFPNEVETDVEDEDENDDTESDDDDDNDADEQILENTSDLIENVAQSSELANSMSSLNLASTENENQSLIGNHLDVLLPYLGLSGAQMYSFYYLCSFI